MREMVAWMDIHQGVAAWVQAFFSVAAIAASVAIVMHQVRRDTRQRTLDLLKARVDLYNGALQLEGAAHAVAGKIANDNAPNWVLADIRLLAIELEGVVDALGHVDHLRFDT